MRLCRLQCLIIEPVPEMDFITIYTVFFGRWIIIRVLTSGVCMLSSNKCHWLFLFIDFQWSILQTYLTFPSTNYRFSLIIRVVVDSNTSMRHYNILMDGAFIFSFLFLFLFLKWGWCSNSKGGLLMYKRICRLM